jgi:hypothetical protein
VLRESISDEGAISDTFQIGHQVFVSQWRGSSDPAAHTGFSVTPLHQIVPLVSRTVCQSPRLHRCHTIDFGKRQRTVYRVYRNTTSGQEEDLKPELA